MNLEKPRKIDTSKVPYLNGKGRLELRCVLEGAVFASFKAEAAKPKMANIADYVSRVLRIDAKVELFGSVAKKMATKDSDTDVLVILPGVSRNFARGIGLEIHSMKHRLYSDKDGQHTNVTVLSDSEDINFF